MPELSGNTYSEIDASNNQAAPNGMPEGMPPSGVNDAWRAGMGAIKRSYDRDHAGAWCTVGGTANAITLTYATGPAAYVQGEKYAFKAIATTTGATTLNINGLGVTNLFKRTPHGPSATAGGEIQSGDIVEVEFDGSEFIMLDLPSNIGNFAGGALTQTTAMSGAAFNEAFATIASAASLAIGAAPANYLQVTGTTTIAAFDTVQAGACRILEFAASLTLTNNANIALPGGANITTQAGDIAKFVSAGGGVWLCAFYTKANGQAVQATPSVFTKSYDSGDQTITQGGSLVLAHGLGLTPKFIQCLLHCQTAEIGYSTGDFVYINPHDTDPNGGPASRGVSVVPDAVNLNIRFGSDSVLVDLLRKDNGVGANITNANWRFVVRAYA